MSNIILPGQDTAVFRGRNDGAVFVADATFAEDEFDGVAIKILDRGVETTAVIISIARGTTRPAARVDCASVAVADLQAIICSESNMGGRRSRAASS